MASIINMVESEDTVIGSGILKLYPMELNSFLMTKMAMKDIQVGSMWQSSILLSKTTEVVIKMEILKSACKVYYKVESRHL